MSLPTGYTEVQYIQSTGTQYVDTEFIPNANTRIFMDVENPSHPSNGSYFGARSIVSATDPNANVMVIMSSGGLRSDYYGNNVSTNTYPSGRHIIDKNKNIVTIGNTSIVNAGSTGSSTYALFIFGTNTAGAFSLAGYLKLYSCQIYDNGTLIRNYIPCINPDGEAGLYDTVNSKFYGNAGTGVFFAGPPKVSLPSGYTQLEYIQSSGTQYVDTEFIPNQDSRIVYDCERLSAAASEHFFGIRTGNSAVAAFCFYIYSSGWRYAYNSATLTGTGPSTGRYVFDANKNIANINGSAAMTGTYAAFTAAASALLFAMRSTPSGLSYGSHKLFTSKLYDNTTLIRDYIPCSNPSGVIGLYDLVNSKFYANAGTGAFTAGPEVTWPSDDAIYVKVNGIWRQIDGIKLL